MPRSRAPRLGRGGKGHRDLLMIELGWEQMVIPDSNIEIQ